MRPIIWFLLIYVFGVLIVVNSYFEISFLEEYISKLPFETFLGIVLILLSFILYYKFQNQGRREEIEKFIFQRLFEIFVVSLLFGVIFSPVITDYKYKTKTDISFERQEEDGRGNVIVHLKNTGETRIEDLVIYAKSSCTRSYERSYEFNSNPVNDIVSINLEDIGSQPVDYGISPTTEQNITWTEFVRRFPEFINGSRFENCKNYCDIFDSGIRCNKFGLTEWINISCYYTLDFKSKNWEGEAIKQGFILKEERVIYIEGIMDEGCEKLKDGILVNSYRY